MQTKHTRMLPFASIPLIFAIQQAIEGGLWMTLRGSGEETMLLTGMFLFFALWWWPAFTPFALYQIEPPGWRRTILALSAGLGLALGLFLFARFLINPNPATIVNQCIYYEYTAPYSTAVIVMYIATTVGVGVMSSRYMIKTLFAVIGLCAFVSSVVYFENFTSVWCFFAAVVSAWIYFIVRGTKKREVHRKH